MTKILLTISVAIFFTTNLFGQAQVDIPLSATDGSGGFSNLWIGLDLSATTCIDSTLGEYVFNVFPPAGVFDSRLDLAPYGCGTILFTLKDYRPPGDPPVFPFTGMIEHTLAFQTSTLGLDILISYNLPDGTQMSITDQIGGSLLNLGPYSGQGTATIPGSYTSIFSRAYLIMEYDNIIPVELTSFKASILQNEKAVQLKWETATETNNQGFEIERILPLPSPYKGKGGEAGRGWGNIGFVPGFGTTTEPKSYSFIDEDVTSGTYKYRLKQIDFDGTFEYSNEIEVEIDFTPKQFVLYQNYPNPFNPSTTIKYEISEKSFVTLKVYDVLGNEIATLVSEEKPAGEYNVEFRIDNLELSSGIYFYQLRADDPESNSGQGFIETKKMVLMK